MASSHKYLYVSFPILLSTLLCFSNAYNLTVGGRDGWTLHPSENYNKWSGRLRFNVNDTLHFKYNGGLDSVMEVNKGDYDTCNTSNSITTLTGGDSVFNLKRSGPFYFISGNKSNCDQGQKLVVVVLFPRKKETPPTVAPAPTVNSTPLESEGSPAAILGGSGTASSSPTANPADVNAPAPRGSGAAKPAISATLIVSIAMIIIF